MIRDYPTRKFLRVNTAMEQWQLSEGADFSRLKLVEVETPRPKSGEVLIKIGAASLNYRDLLTAKNSKIAAGRVPLSDGAGEVVELGEGVSKWKIGDRVAPIFFRDWHAGRFESKYHDTALGGSVNGVLSEFVAAHEADLVEIPAHFSSEEAATLPCAGVTAWCGLQRGGFVAGDCVLLQGTGGVSIFGLQFVVAMGGTTIITSSSDEKLTRALEMGAQSGINYRKMPDWDKEVWRLTGKRGVDQILEVGGPGTLGKSLASVASGGHIAQIGVLTGFAAPDASLFPLVSKNATLSGIYVGSREHFEALVRFLNATKIRPIIDRTFDFDDAPAAFGHMESGAHFGKIVISMEQ